MKISAFSCRDLRTLAMISCRPMLILLLAFFACGYLHATPTMSSLFSDHMVLQREVPIRVGGTARAGESIRVYIADQSLATQASGDGAWSITLAPMLAGGPYDLTVRGDETVIFHDVLVGEVWIASGQSNMDFPLRRSDDANDELSHAELPWVRLYKVPRESTFTRQHTTDAEWTLCNPASADDFSAVAYSFAKDLQARLHVPVGIIQSTWSGSTGEEWTSYESLANSAELRPILDRWKDAGPGVEQFARDGEDFSLRFDSFQLWRNDLSSVLHFSDFDQRLATTSDGGFWWTAKPAYARLVRESSGDALEFFGHMSLNSIPALTASRPNPDQTEYDWKGYEGIRFRVHGPGCFHLHLEEPEIVDGNVYSSRRICIKDEWENISLGFRDFKQAGWGVPEELDLRKILRLSVDPESHISHAGERPPAGLYNGMISPLAKYTFRGVLWYQGEGNATRAVQYRTLLSSIISSWRQMLAAEDLPFLIVQLPNLGTPSLNAEDSAWAELRESQAMAAAHIHDVGMVTTIDLGEAINLHPPHKREVGRRLSLLARAEIYGEAVEFSGPLFKDIAFKCPKIELTFSHAEKLSTIDGGPVKGFAIAGEDRKFHPAMAKIIGDKVVLSNPDVQHPLAVRYGWAGNPICNLTNASHLPAAPFRTDAWKGVTAERR